ncbi:hypothetical protein LOTGIDRAFT_163158 [Lottia gigantea]|uniref:Uncharacterized protein n=1 Tax=Lottia gigantea TaxID=225164 RepID=V3ZKE6_LOTGI|nr:hypothetical protein LOTGIDRAFT_163158 [Lottia gigantea]ESO91798.1 hypothetical protein LOTGIDRAFT_163158 [Lottia gigantea]
MTGKSEDTQQAPLDNDDVIELVNEENNDEPITKKSRSAIEELLEDFFTEDNTAISDKNKACTNPVVEEIRLYRSGDNISLNANVLNYFQFKNLSNIVSAK